MIFAGRPEGRRPLGSPRLIGNAMLKHILDKQHRRLWTRFIWLKIGTNRRLK
jgi:hypothetical protein